MKLAVLITYHNEKSLLTECLNSLLKNSELPDEVLIFDDASQFPAKDYVIDGLSIRIIHSDKNVGPAVGRNRLLKAANSEWVHFHDADDGFFPSWTQAILSETQDKECDAIFTEVTSYQGGKLFVEKVIGFNSERAQLDLLSYTIRNFVLVPSGTYKKVLVEEIGGYRESLWQSEDFDFHVRLLNRKIKTKILLTPLVWIRLRDESRSLNKVETSEGSLNAIEGLATELPEKYQQDLGWKAAQMGMLLFQIGEIKKARSAFDLAEKLGGVSGLKRGMLYEFLAQTCGLMKAEQIAALYRRSKV